MTDRLGHKTGAVFQRPGPKRTPHAKKQLSYAKDCRDSYFGNAKAARVAIPRFKKLSNRAERAAVSAATPDAEGHVPAPAENRALKRAHPHRRKGSDLPLGDYLDLKAQRSRHRSER